MSLQLYPDSASWFTKTIKASHGSFPKEDKPQPHILLNHCNLMADANVGSREANKYLHEHEILSWFKLYFDTTLCLACVIRVKQVNRQMKMSSISTYAVSAVAKVLLSLVLQLSCNNVNSWHKNQEVTAPIRGKERAVLFLVVVLSVTIVTSENVGIKLPLCFFLSLSVLKQTLFSSYLCY